METPTSRNATEHDEEHQLKFRFVDVGLPIRSSIRASLSLRGGDSFDESQTPAGSTSAPLDVDGADAPKNAMPTAGGCALSRVQDSAISLGIYRISEASSGSTSRRSRHVRSEAEPVPVEDSEASTTQPPSAELEP